MYRTLLLIVMAGVASNIAAMNAEVTKKDRIRGYLETKKRQCLHYDAGLNNQEPTVSCDDPRLRPPTKKRRARVSNRPSSPIPFVDKTEKVIISTR